MRVESSTLIQKPVGSVWDFYATRHIQNHPRWDPAVELQATSDDPIGLGTVLSSGASRGSVARPRGRWRWSSSSPRS